jgi:hypothetical protein
VTPQKIQQMNEKKKILWDFIHIITLSDMWDPPVRQIRPTKENKGNFYGKKLETYIELPVRRGH